MINYVTIGTNDLACAATFYDAVFELLNASRIHDQERFVFYSDGQGPGIMIVRPYDGQPATVGNGMMVALKADSTGQVDAVYRKALELGGTCAGEPGERGGVSYGAYFRDLDGNKLAVIHLIA